LIANAWSRLPFDDDHRGFIELPAPAIAGALTKVRAPEDEHRRPEALAAIECAKIASFANVIQEFRTLVTLLLGGVLGIDRPAARALEPAKRTRATLAYRQAQRLVGLVNALLDSRGQKPGARRALTDPRRRGPLAGGLGRWACADSKVAFLQKGRVGVTSEQGQCSAFT
jgi:hypothetical protein